MGTVSITMSEEATNTDTSASTPSVKFRAPKKAMSLRKKRNDSDDDVDDTHEPAAAADHDTTTSDLTEAEKIMALKLKQKMRTKQKGGYDCAQPKHTPANEDTTTQDESKYGLVSSEDNTSISLGSTFTVQSQKSEVELQMHKYIEEKMADKRKLNSDFKEGANTAMTISSSKAPVVTKKEADEKLLDELYRVPDELKVGPRREDGQNDVEVETVDRYLTGIQEVDLPIDSRIHNIEETERMKRNLIRPHKQLEDQPQKKRKRPSTLRAVAEQLNIVSDASAEGGWGASHRFGGLMRPGHGAGYGNVQQATDDLAVDKFRKNYLRRFGR
eukprot:c8014_g1_i1.p1 GENE.c8014_g1_i1~~c8014_g1_i1.p1  ORF type:complete len:329 (+),score=94.39 c8014_g1_i1:2-988(+)